MHADQRDSRSDDNREDNHKEIKAAIARRWVEPVERDCN